MKPLNKLFLGAVLMAVLLIGTAATIVTGYRTATTIGTNSIAIIDWSQTNGGKIYRLSSSNFLEDLKVLPNWPAIGAGDVTTAQLTAATNPIVIRATATEATNATQQTAIADLQGAANSLDSRITANTTAIGNLQAATNSLDTRATAATASIANLQSATNAMNTRVGTLESARVVTNYAHATTMTLNVSTDVKASVTNSTSANVAVTFGTPVPGTSGRLLVTSDSSVRTLSFLCASATLTPLATNNMSNTTNAQTTASKRLMVCWDVNLKSPTDTNILYWVISQP